MSTKLLSNGTVVTFDDATESIKILENASVLIKDGQIASISENRDSMSIPSDAEIIDVTGKIVSPGFINTHAHMWQTAYRTMGPNVTLMQYFLWPSQSGTAQLSYTPDDIYISCLEGYLEALNAGTTSIVEHAHNDWAKEVFFPAYDAAVDGGARVWYCYAPAGREGWTEEEQYEAMAELNKRQDDPKGLITRGLAYDNFGGAKEGEIESTKEIIKKLDLRAITIHYLGGPWFGGGFGNSPADAAKHGFQKLDLPIIFSHGGFIRESDKEALRSHNWNLSITPESEMHYGHGQVTSKYIMDQASLGIDTNWTFSGDLIPQARLWLQSVRKELYQPVLDAGKVPEDCPFDVADAFLLMTRQGGRAVRRDDLGVLKVGAKADIVVIDGESPNMLGWTDPVAAVVLHANVGDIQHVLVDGEFRKRDWKLVLKKGDWKDISKKFASAARRIQHENKDGRPPLSGSMWGSDLEAVERLSTRKGGK